MRLAKSPNDLYTFGNLVAVAPQDFRPSADGSDTYLLINDQFVLSARPLDGFPPGHISLSDGQRTWGQIALTDTVKVQPYDPFRQGAHTYLASLDVEIGFASRKTTEVPYDQDELAQHVVRNFESQIFAPGQQILMDHKSIKLRLIVRTVQLGDLSMEKASTSASATTSSPSARGILTRQAEINFFKDTKGTGINIKASNRRPAANAILQPNFKFEDMGIGGLDTEFATVFRRAFASRIFPPGLVEKLGIQHVKGVLLYGPPGTGKTLIARQIGKMLNAREPKVINGPEVLNKFVGQSEENIRKLFADAEKEYKEKGEESGLHIIIFDELDAICKQRGSGAGGGTGVGDSVVNQLLSKLDGVDQLNNILLIGMTNRMDMIDDALLRPGRLELHIEISLPDEAGRVQILKIHTKKMRENNVMSRDVDVAELAALTKNFSGAEIAGLVKAATSFAFQRHTKVGTMAGVGDDVADLKVNRDDFMRALEEVHSMFGVSEDDLQTCMRRGILHFSPTIGDILRKGEVRVEQVRTAANADVFSVLLHGPPGAGKTALAVQVALASGFPFVKLVRGEDMIGYTEIAKVQAVHKIFTDAYKSPLSVIVIDDLELLMEWSPIGPRYSNALFTALRTLLSKSPPKNRRLLILGTTSEHETMGQLSMLKWFNERIAVPYVRGKGEFFSVLKGQGAFGGEEQRRQAVGMLHERVGEDMALGIKDVLLGLEGAQYDKEMGEVESFVEMMADKIGQRGL